MFVTGKALIDFDVDVGFGIDCDPNRSALTFFETYPSAFVRAIAADCLS